jgi:heme oxygenase
MRPPGLSPRQIAAKTRPTMSLLDRLRTETAERHRRLEDALDLMRPDLTRRDWTRLVARVYGFYEPWEAAIARAVHGGEIAEMAAQRRKASWLEQDLVALDVSPDARATLPRCEHLPSLDSPARVLGSMYVLEGATLGGQHISRHVEATLGLSGGRGDSFFRSYGPRTGQMWQAFRRTVSALAPALDADTMVEAACQTFDRFHNWLTRGPGEPLTCP